MMMKKKLMWSVRVGAVLLVLTLVACSSQPSHIAADGWHAVHLPGKVATRYQPGHHHGRQAVAAHAEASASMWRRKLQVPAAQLGEVSFSWRVEEKPGNASVADVSREDAAARVLFAFDGPVAALPPRTRAMFELAEALTGERPPYATLMYVWDHTAPVGTVIVNPRSDRVRKIVLDSGPMHLGQWREHRRNLAADFEKAFGEKPGQMTSMAYMSDSDNTQSRARAWFGAVQLHP